MSGEYEPGTVAIIRPLNTESTTRAICHRNGEWMSADWGSFLPDELADVRPLVVLDLSEIVVSPMTHAEMVSDYARDTGSDLLAEIARQIKAQTEPPRIPEPGLWGVVEAGCKCDPGRVGWVLHGTLWMDLLGDRHEWSDLIRPTLIREGVES